ncbi:MULTISPECIES: class I SAM-dependent methyltransferase [Metabacillus]|jgi:hypothetical protein|uniref:Class I SAM-dependent methyltransferase n=3 Tax=Metabacillus TaxID=2675233 RepID=A0A179SZD5_9BACI|nr:MULTISPECIES: class I SAM-dependent methyltransferase [Metabacillus]OAS86199.1 hypothetical protein A6K24_21995 [Metabacillus litoralis]QNF27886.1 SAM-dependent methyltransferase [Metabacillus sp. KUDC1714]
MTADFRWFLMDKVKVDEKTNDTFSKLLSFYKQQLLNIKGKILEVGVNQPLLLPALKESGLQIEGIVPNSQKVESNSVKVYHAELANLKLPSFYDVIIIPFGYILTIQDRVEAIKTLKCCYEHLRPNGKIMIDLILQDEFHLNQRKVETKNRQGQLIICESQVIEVDFYAQIVKYLLSYEQWNEGEVILSERKLQSFLWFGVKEFKLVLERIGFMDVKLYGNYQESKSNVGMSDMKMFTFEASKKV